MQAAHFQCCHNQLKSFFLERASTRSGANVHYLLDSCHVKTWLRCHMTCWVGSSHSSYHPARFVGLVPCESNLCVGSLVTWLCGGIPSPKVTTLLSFESIGLQKVNIEHLWFVTWPRGRCVTWLVDGVSPF